MLKGCVITVTRASAVDTVFCCQKHKELQNQECVGGVLSKLRRYVPPHRVGFLRRFGLKTGIHFAHFGLESGMVFEGTTGVYERIYRFSSKLMSKKEGEICEFEIDLKNFFVCALI